MTARKRTQRTGSKICPTMTRGKLSNGAARALLFAWLLILACGRGKPTGPRETLLARVGDRTLTVQEFLRRAEYTPRPAYCSGNTPVHKKIVLNSLIAEKLLAIEAQDTSSLARSRWFQLFLQGRKEQAVRDWFYQLAFYDKVHLDDAELRRAARLIGRRYHVQYVTVQDSAGAAVLYEARRCGWPLDSVVVRLGGLGSPAERTVTWTPTESQFILDSLFLQPIRKGQLVGPIQTVDGSVVLLRVVGWRDRVEVGSVAQQRAIRDAQARLRESKASAAYRQWVARLMRGKELHFFPEMFWELVRALEPLYLTTDGQLRSAIQQTAFGTPGDSARIAASEGKLEALAGRPVLRIDGQVWTVARLHEEMLKHPLVFRRKWISRREFPNQLRLAIADLVRDRFVTDEALRRGYGDLEVVQREVSMWRDALLAAYQRECLLRSWGLSEAFAENPQAVLDTVLTPYVRGLFRRYSDEIEIDTDTFNALQLTRIHLFALRPAAPFRVVVPPFPMLTTQHRLDYGRKLEQQ